MGKYVVKRILLMFFTLFVIVTICFMLIRMLPRELPQEKALRDLEFFFNEALAFKMSINESSILLKLNFCSLIFEELVLIFFLLKAH